MCLDQTRFFWGASNSCAFLDLLLGWTCFEVVLMGSPVSGIQVCLGGTLIYIIYIHDIYNLSFFHGACISGLSVKSSRLGYMIALTGIQAYGPLPALPETLECHDTFSDLRSATTPWDPLSFSLPQTLRSSEQSTSSSAKYCSMSVVEETKRKAQRKQDRSFFEESMDPTELDSPVIGLTFDQFTHLLHPFIRG